MLVSEIGDKWFPQKLPSKMDGVVIIPRIKDKFTFFASNSNIIANNEAKAKKVAINNAKLLSYYSIYP